MSDTILSERKVWVVLFVIIIFYYFFLPLLEYLSIHVSQTFIEKKIKEKEWRMDFYIELLVVKVMEKERKR